MESREEIKEEIVIEEEDDGAEIVEEGQSLNSIE